MGLVSRYLAGTLPKAHFSLATGNFAAPPTITVWGPDPHTSGDANCGRSIHKCQLWRNRYPIGPSGPPVAQSGLYAEVL